jgi:hypothetical protein
MRRIDAGLAAALGIACCIGVGGARAAGQSGATPAAKASSAAPASFAGCVQPLATDKTTLVLSGEAVCARLTGSFPVEKLAGHEVELKGVLTLRTDASSAAIQVGSVVSVGKSCTAVCALQPPRTRGLHRNDVEQPGSEGGTPGAAQKPTPPPQ